MKVQISATMLSTIMSKELRLSFAHIETVQKLPLTRKVKLRRWSLQAKQILEKYI